jgi:putative heme-binding domain-containing protein
VPVHRQRPERDDQETLMEFGTRPAAAAFLTLTAAAVFAWSVHAQGPGQDHAGQYAQSDIAYGAQLYAAQCATCHGANGDAVGGVNLRTGQIRRAATDNELMRLITTGIPGAGMPGFRFVQAEQLAIVAYVRNMNSLDAGSVKLGNPSRGRAVFEGKGECLRCHAVNDKGSVAAPDLTDIGVTRAPSMLERHIIDPTAQMMPINRPVRAVMKDGKTVTGRRLNEDTYSIQLMDDDGRLRSLLKNDVKQLEVLTTSRMPSYKDKLSADEVSDLVAYLLTLKGA